MIMTSGPSNIRIYTLAGDSAISSTTAASISGIAIPLEVGTYVLEYYIRAISATATVSLKYGLNFTGTQTMIMYNLYFPSAGVTAATGVVDQEVNTTTGQVWAFNGTRTNNTVLGPATDVDTINVDIMYRITGMIIVTVAGSLQLLHGSETATSTTTKAGTCAIITKTA